MKEIKEIWKVPKPSRKRFRTVRQYTDGSFSCTCLNWMQTKQECEHIKKCKKKLGPDYIIPKKDITKGYGFISNELPIRELVNNELKGRDFSISMEYLSKKIKNIVIRLDIVKFQYPRQSGRSLNANLVFESFKRPNSMPFSFKDYAWVIHIHLDDEKKCHDACAFIFLEPLDYKKISKEIKYVWYTRPPATIKEEFADLCEEIRRWVENDFLSPFPNPDLEIILRKRIKE